MVKRRSTYKDFMDGIYKVRAREGKKIYERLAAKFAKEGMSKTQ